MRCFFGAAVALCVSATCAAGPVELNSARDSSVWARIAAPVEQLQELPITSLPSTTLASLSSQGGTGLEGAVALTGSLFSGSADLTVNGDGLANFSVGVYFRATQNTTYNLSGMLDLQGEADIFMTAELADITPGQFSQSMYSGFEQNSSGSPGTFVLTEGGFNSGSLSGDLLAGHEYIWRFFVEVDTPQFSTALAEGFATFGLQFGDSPVIPLPGAAGMAAAGMVVLGGRRRRVVI